MMSDPSRLPNPKKVNWSSYDEREEFFEACPHWLNILLASEFLATRSHHPMGKAVLNSVRSWLAGKMTSLDLKRSLPTQHKTELHEASDQAIFLAKAAALSDGNASESVAHAALNLWVDSCRVGLESEFLVWQTQYIMRHLHSGTEELLRCTANAPGRSAVMESMFKQGFRFLQVCDDVPYASVGTFRILVAYTDDDEDSYDGFFVYGEIREEAQHIQKSLGNSDVEVAVGLETDNGVALMPLLVRITSPSCTRLYTTWLADDFRTRGQLTYFLKMLSLQTKFRFDFYGEERESMQGSLIIANPLKAYAAECLAQVAGLSPWEPAEVDRQQEATICKYQSTSDLWPTLPIHCRSRLLP